MDLADRIEQTNQLREQSALLERRCSLMSGEAEEIRLVLEQSDSARKMAELELVEVLERVNLLSTQV